MKAAVLGTGSWGTALAQVLAVRLGFKGSGNAFML